MFMHVKCVCCLFLCLIAFTRKHSLTIVSWDFGFRHVAICNSVALSDTLMRGSPILLGFPPFFVDYLSRIFRYRRSLSNGQIKKDERNCKKNTAGRAIHSCWYKRKRSNNARQRPFEFIVISVAFYSRSGSKLRTAVWEKFKKQKGKKNIHGNIHALKRTWDMPGHQSLSVSELFKVKCPVLVRVAFIM